MINIEIFKLFGSILIDNDAANKSIDSTDKKAEGLGNKLGGMIGTAAKWGAGILAGATVAGGAMVGLATKVADTMGNIDDMAQRTGTTAEEFQKLSYAAKLSGMEAEALEKAMIKQQKAFADAKDGSKAMSEAYQRMGIDIENIGSSSEAFDLVIKRLADMKDESERNALANDIFGKSYAELTPLLNQGAEGIEALKNEAVALGGVMSNESVAAGANFGDTLDKLKTALGGVFNSIGAQLIPIMQSFGDWIIAHMPEIQATFDTVFGVINTVVTKAYEIFNNNIKPVLVSLYDWVQLNMPTIKAVFSDVWGVISSLISQVWHIFEDNLLPILKSLYDFVEPTFPVIKDIIGGAFETIVGIVQTAVDIFDKLTGAIKIALDWLKKWKNERENIEDGNFSSVNGNGHGGGGIGGFASGTDDAPGGWSWVGEEGAELMYVPQHSKIIPNDKINSVGNAEATELTVNIPVILEGKTLTSLVSTIQLDNTRNRARAMGVSL